MHFRYACHSVGHFYSGFAEASKPVDVENMTKMAAHAAQKEACKRGQDFDLANFQVAVRVLVPAGS
jgi:hypothetical protein